jgi:hypothetical protein
MKEIIGALAAILVLATGVQYLRGLVRGKIHPHPYSWLIWTATASIEFGLRAAGGAGAGAYPTLAAALVCAVTFVLAWRTGGDRLITRHDKISLAVAGAAIVLWAVARQPMASMLLVLGADLFGLLPTIRKTWHAPHSEPFGVWVVDTIIPLLNIIAISQYSLLTVVGPATWFLASGGFCLVMLARRRAGRRRTERPEQLVLAD